METKMYSTNTQAQVPTAALNLAPMFQATEARMRRAHEKHLGYPYNLSFEPGVPAPLGNYLINNLGDPYAGSHYASEVCALELEAVQWLMNLWGCVSHEDYWGSIGASGTEGNLWGIYLGREALPDAVLLYSADAHYSIPKAARIQRIVAHEVASLPTGEMDLDALGVQLKTLNGTPVILAVTCGTTMKGAHDDIGGALRVLASYGYDRCNSYVHVDGALNAMVLPFAKDVPEAILPNFTLHALDSISTSGHKMIGTPMPCGALVCRREHSTRVARSIAYLRSNDTTLMGSRNGHAVLAIWSRLIGHGETGFMRDVESCIAGAERLATALTKLSVPVLLNPYSLTVVFPEPAISLVKTYQLACYQGQAHAIVMPNVTQALLDEFVASYAVWWSGKA
jgi:histidine decarboxylase